MRRWSTPSTSTNLPAPRTSFIGREQEVAMLCQLLRRPDVRLLTLTGAPGIGKTRLGLQVAADVIDDFEGMVRFVALASIHDPGQVIAAIAQTLGVKDAAAGSLLTQLKHMLHDRHQ